MGTELFDLAYALWDRARGFDETLPLYSGGLPSFSVEDLQKSFRSRDLRNPYFVEFEAEGFTASAQASTQGRFVVTRLVPLAVPAENETTDTEIHFYDFPDWMGEGVLVEYTPCGYRVTNRLRFHFDFHSSTLLGDGLFQYIDHQPVAD